VGRSISHISRARRPPSGGQSGCSRFRAQLAVETADTFIPLYLLGLLYAYWRAHVFPFSNSDGPTNFGKSLGLARRATDRWHAPPLSRMPSMVTGEHSPRKTDDSIHQSAAACTCTPSTKVASTRVSPMSSGGIANRSRSRMMKSAAFPTSSDPVSRSRWFSVAPSIV